MHRKAWLTGSTLAAIALLGNLHGANEESNDAPTPIEAPASKFTQPTSISPFTGRVTKNKVRLRVQPSLDAKILKELSKDDLVVVVGESDDFYAIKPPTDTKGYVFRTFVLDNVIEGNRVNVRLEPELDAPIIAQLSSGDRVDGTISPLNSKWIEMTPPSSVRFYIAKEYLEKIGDPNLMARIQQRRVEVNSLLSTAYNMSQSELQKPFPEINLNGAISTYNKIIQQFGDFPEQVARAKELLTSVQEKYLQSKIAYLESRAQLLDSHYKNGAIADNKTVNSNDVKVTVIPSTTQSAGTVDVSVNSKGVTAKMASWNANEQKLLEQWLQDNQNGNAEQFYNEQNEHAVTLKGSIENYNRNIKNKPGDYLLVNPNTHLPTAYLYSTQVNLQELVGHEVTLKAAPRPNNNFAFPAYYILSHD
jgi:hypothetical protein